VGRLERGDGRIQPIASLLSEDREDRQSADDQEACRAERQHIAFRSPVTRRHPGGGDPCSRAAGQGRQGWPVFTHGATGRQGRFSQGLGGLGHSGLAMLPGRGIVHLFDASARILSILSLGRPHPEMKFTLAVTLGVTSIVWLGSQAFVAAASWLAADSVCRITTSSRAVASHNLLAVGALPATALPQCPDRLFPAKRAGGIRQ